MTSNVITCIVVLTIGIILLLASIYQFCLSRKEPARMILAVPFCLVGALFIITPLFHWNDDKEYKEYKVIECTSYEIEIIHIEKNNSLIEEKYKIYYKND